MFKRNDDGELEWWYGMDAYLEKQTDWNDENAICVHRFIPYGIFSSGNGYCEKCHRPGKINQMTGEVEWESRESSPEKS